MSGDPRPRGALDEGGAEAEDDIEARLAAGDVEGLVTLARAYRSGTAPGGRDMAKCFEAYRAAASLGSGDAEYAVALFLLNGGPVPQDLKEGATHLRAAAERGNVPAKVFLGNMYELGLHYKADPEKADVWYRNAARSAGVEARPGTDTHTRELAELGCARYVLAVVERGAPDDATKTRLMAKARALGYGLKVKTEEPVATPGDRATFEGALASAEAAAGGLVGAGAAAGTVSPAAGAADVDREADTTLSPRRAKGVATADALAAFGYAILFVLAGAGAAYVAVLAARELAAHGTKLPPLATKPEVVFGAVLTAVGILPTMLVYRAGAVIKAIVAGAMMAGVGWVSWGTGQAVLHPVRLVQAVAFGLPGFVAALLVLGFTGGTKLGAKRARKRVLARPRA